LIRKEKRKGMILEKGWHEFYHPYVKIEEEEIPHVKENDIIDVKKITCHDKETSYTSTIPYSVKKPPRRLRGKRKSRTPTLIPNSQPRI